MLSRQQLLSAVRYLSLLLGLVSLYVLFDYSFDRRPPQVHSSYQFSLADLPLDRAQWLRQDNLSIVVIRRSPATIDALLQSDDRLQDVESTSSHQPDFAGNRLRSRHPGYFVAYALGTDFGCGLREEGLELIEICGQARYDFAGRAIEGDKQFQNLTIPDYTFTNDFNTLTIRP